MGNLDKLRKGDGKRRQTRSRPSLEWLEHRVTPSTFHVNTLLDTDAVNLKTGTDSSGHVSLRSAIMAADAQGGSNKIILPAGTFTLTLAGTSDDNGTAGELDIHANVTIQGRGAGQTIIDGHNTDRVIEVLGGNVSITGVTIQHGRVTGDGGGILNDGGRLSLRSVVVANNVAVGAPGSFGGGTGGTGGTGQGGGIFNEAGSLTLTKTTITSNQAIGGDGGNGGVIIFIEPAITSNQNGGAAVGNNGDDGGQGGAGEGGGIFNAAGATVTLSGATITSNQATGGNGGVGTIGFDATGGPGGPGGNGIGGNGGRGGPTSGNPDNIGGPGGAGGHAVGGTGGQAGVSGDGDGGGLFIAVGGTVIYRARTAAQTLAASTFTGNRAIGGNATGGAGGGGGIHAAAGIGGSANGDPVTSGTTSTEGAGGTGGDAGNGNGGGLCNAGTASFTGVTVDVTSNQAVSGTGGTGGAGGSATGGAGGGSGIAGIPSTGGSATGGTGGASGEGASGVGGGILNATTGTLTLKPRLGAKKGSRQAQATDGITTNKALAATGGQAGAGGSATGGLGQPSLGVNGVNGVATPGQPGVTDLFSAGVGGGLANFDNTAFVDNTIISGNQASTSDPNGDGKLTS